MNGPDPIHVTDAEVAEVMDAEAFVTSCDDAFRLYGTGELRNPARSESVTRTGDEELFRLEMPAEWEGRYRSRKVIEERSGAGSGRLGERSAWLEIEELATGRRAVLDAETLTNGRTGAAGVLGASYLGSQPFASVSILGTGRIAGWLALCADHCLRPGQIRVTSRREQNREKFLAQYGPSVTADLVAASSIAETTAGADVILTCIPTPTPVLERNFVDPASHISVIAGDPRTRQLGEGFLLERNVVPDHALQAAKSGDFLAEQGSKVEFVRIHEEGRQDEDATADIGDAALGRLEHVRGTGSIAYFTGLAIQDLHAAVTALRKMRVFVD